MLLVLFTNKYCPRIICFANIGINDFASEHKLLSYAEWEQCYLSHAQFVIFSMENIFVATEVYIIVKGGPAFNVFTEYGIQILAI